MVSLNKFYCEGALVMTRVLEVNLNLREVVLERNEIGVEGAVALAGTLRKISVLTKLVFNGNGLKEGVLKLAKSFKYTDNLIY